jgi:amino acid transporter
VKSAEYKSDSLTLFATVAMGIGVMIGAGIFALTGQVAEYAGGLFPAAFLLAAIISGISAYSYIRVTSKYPSAGGVAMILEKAYGKRMMTGACALLMAFSMIINESLVARTFGTYTLQLFDVGENYWLVSALAVALIVAAFLVNIAGNKIIGAISKVTAIVKILGILAFSGAALWAADWSFKPAETGISETTSVTGFLAGVALAILAYKGFTTITNSGSEVVDPHKNVGRAIMISLAVCLIVYMLVAWGVGSALSISEIVEARDYSLAEAAKPAMGSYGVWFTVAIAIIATSSGLLASIFAVSRMLAMVTEMNIIPHRHFGMPGDIQTHTLVYTVVSAAFLAAFFDLSRIASLGAIFYLVMDIAIHWGVLKHLREDVDARAWVLVTALVLDVIVLACFVFIKGSSDPVIVVIAIVSILGIFVFEKYFLSKKRAEADNASDSHSH